MAESSPRKVENTVERGEIAHYEQFLLFQHCFQRPVSQSKGVIVWEWVKRITCSMILIYTGLKITSNL